MTTPDSGSPDPNTPVFQAPVFDSPEPQQTAPSPSPESPPNTEPSPSRESPPNAEPSPSAQPLGSRPLLVVDAANVIGSRPDGWWKDRAGAARRLLTNLATYQQGPGAHTDITVILEGAARPAADAIPNDHPLQVVLAPHSGDDTIVDVVTEATTQNPTREITVVTADRGLRARVEPLGAQTTGPNWLHTRLGSR
ncbi:hypothetical protein [Kribbella sp. DT2]|uniref:hypothetical protein n=1 Tax=Kribbella sp. DT2 TaxID=3393427 RepID=UPI003CF089CF